MKSTLIPYLNTSLNDLALKLKTNVRSLSVLFCMTLCLTACKKERSEADLAKDFLLLDTYLRKPDFHYDSLRQYLAEIQQDFAHSERKYRGYEAWTTTVDYKWSADSSITLLNAYKTYPIGFSRETIMHSKDSTLFVHRFSTEPLGLENREDFTFLESILYLTEMGTIRHLARISYREGNLKDTIEFRKKPFTDLTDNISHYYSMELNYSKSIMGE